MNNTKRGKHKEARNYKFPRKHGEITTIFLKKPGGKNQVFSKKSLKFLFIIQWWIKRGKIIDNISSTIKICKFDRIGTGKWVGRENSWLSKFQIFLLGLPWFFFGIFLFFGFFSNFEQRIFFRGFQLRFFRGLER